MDCSLTQPREVDGENERGKEVDGLVRGSKRTSSWRDRNQLGDQGWISKTREEEAEEGRGCIIPSISEMRNWREQAHSLSCGGGCWEDSGGTEQKRKN